MSDSVVGASVAVAESGGPGLNVVILSPHFPPNFSPFAVRLHEAGHRVFGIADVEYHDLRPDLRDALTAYYRVDDLHDYEALVRALEHFSHRYGRIHRLDSMNEYWLETEARLRADFDIWGLRPEDMAAVKRKSVMKDHFRMAGVRVARGRVCRSADDTWAFVAEVGYPVVAKPDIGVGAAGTYKLADAADVERYLADKAPVDYILEEYVAGRIVTYDGLTDLAGNVVFESSLEYSRGVMEVVNEDTDVYYYMVREIADDLRQAGRAIVSTFGVRERFFHFEFFRLDDGSLVALEVNMRPPGGLSIDMFNYANDLDVQREWVNVLTHGRAERTALHPYFCAYVGRKNRFAYRRSHEEVLAAFGPLVVQHQPIEGVFSGAIGDYGYVLRHPELPPLLEAAHAIQERA